MKYFKYLGGFLLLAVLVSGFYLARSTEAAVTKEALTKAAKGDFKLLQQQSSVTNEELVVTPVGSQQIFLTQTKESQYRKQFPWLDAKHTINITAPASTDVYINNIAHTFILNNQSVADVGHFQSGIASSTAERIVSYYPGSPESPFVLYRIPKGETRMFTINDRVDTGQLFKGTYHSEVDSLFYRYLPALGGGGWMVQSVPNQTAKTNTISVLGEKSPYIKTFNDKIPVGSEVITGDVYPGQVVSIKGTDVLTSDVHLDGKITTVGEFQKINGPTVIKEVRYVIPPNIALGVHNIYLNDVIFGKSNTVWFRVVNRPTTPPCTLTRDILTVGTVDAVQVPILSRYLNRVTGSTLSTNGTVFSEAVKAALIKEQSVARAYPIYVNLNYYNRAWINGRLTVADCGTNQTPGIVAQLVNTSTEVVGSNPERGDFAITFDVTALGSDVYLDGDTFRSTSTVIATSTDGLIFSTDDVVNASNTPASVLISTTSQVGDITTPGAISYKIPKDNTRRFTLNVVIVPHPNSISTTRVKIDGLKWDIDSGDQHQYLYTNGLSSFVTNMIILHGGSSVATKEADILAKKGLMASTWEAFQNFLVRIAVGR